jgi:hypothetical protein
MGKNIGTLIAAAIRPNDSLDAYPVALQEEIKGGAHTRASIADMNAIGAYLREAGMTCYVIANSTTYQLENDLQTWVVYEQQGGGSPGTGGDSADISLLSGNFGAWTPLNSPSGDTIDQIELQYKTDLSAFPNRVITYLQGQFGLTSGFTGTTITLGNLPVNNRPSANIIKYLIVSNIELYLLINTDGDVILSSKDGFNLPANDADDTGATNPPYYIDTFFQPLVATVYSSTRTESFTRNNCGAGYTGSAVNYSQTYTSTISQADADAAAAADSTFEASGQVFANNSANGATCTLNPVVPSTNVSIYNGAPFPIVVGIVGAENYSFDVAAGATVTGTVGAYTYTSVNILGPKDVSKAATVNGVTQGTTNASIIFDSVSTPITATVS